jgi:DNA-binding HxlR family transcriptional regulator
MRRTSVGRVECPVARALDEIGDWWSLLIIRDAFDGMRRFGEFQKSLGISKGILTARLKHLVAIGVLEMNPISDEDGYQEYVLTDKGRDLFLVTVSLRQWGEDHCFGKSEPHSVLLEKANGQRVPRLALRRRDGKELSESATFVRKVADASRKPHNLKRRRATSV